MMKRLRDFWRWLHRSDKFSWKRPDGWDEIRVRISKRAEDHRRALQVKTYTPEQLTILYCHASRLVRSFILLGLNCGFKPAEIATLTKDEIRGDTIKRVRIKSGVYGEWKMWPETLEAVKWAMGRSDGQLVFLTSTGNPYNSKTATGSKPNKIPSLWNNLYRTISKREGEFPKLPISALRDTAANWMRANHGGEITGIYLAHGQPVRTDALADVYSNRPFHLVHDALTAYRKHLQDMFKGA